MKLEQAAFPVVKGKDEKVESAGLSKRELIAAMAMGGILSNPNLKEFGIKEMATVAKQCTDSLLEALQD